MSTFWWLLGESKPSCDATRRLAFVKAFERLLLSATAGAFLFALVRNFPVHAKEFSLQPDADYTLDRILRYLCLTWFLAYFFVSSANNELSLVQRRCKDIGFDVFQSLAVLTATYCLGFVLPDHGFSFDDGLFAFLVSNIVVLAICLLSLGLFSENATDGLTRVRRAGAALAAIAVLVAWLAPPRATALLVLLILQVLLWAVWGAFFRLRIDK